MRIIYKVSLKKPLEIPDFWRVPFLSGELTPISENKLVKAFEIQFSGQPVEYAPLFSPLQHGKVKGNITVRDELVPKVQAHLENALAFIQCTFDVEVEIDEIAAEYKAENEDEEKKKQTSHRDSVKSGFQPTLEGSSTFASRRNFAASSGGVGLM